MDNNINIIEREKEIDQFLKEFGELWKQYPEYRFGQMIENVKYDELLNDMFYTTDKDFLYMLKLHMLSLNY